MEDSQFKTKAILLPEIPTECIESCTEEAKAPRMISKLGYLIFLY